MKLTIFLISFFLVNSCYAVQYLKGHTPEQRRAKLEAFAKGYVTQEIRHLPAVLKEKACHYNVHDYTHNHEVQKILAVHNNLRKEWEHCKKVYKGEITDETVEQANRIFNDRIKAINEYCLKKSPLFIAFIPRLDLFVQLSPQELLAFIDYYRINKAKL